MQPTNILKTNKEGVESLFEELKKPKGWWPVIPKDNASYYVFFRDNIPLCFCGVVYKSDKQAEIEGLYASKEHKDATAIFELCDYVSFLLASHYVKIYVINDIALFAWLRCGFKILKSKKMKYWTAYWVERNPIL